MQLSSFSNFRIQEFENFTISIKGNNSYSDE